MPCVSLQMSGASRSFAVGTGCAVASPSSRRRQIRTKPPPPAQAETGRAEALSFVHAPAEATGLPAASYDLVSMCLVAHELPQSATRSILREAFRWALRRARAHVRASGCVAVCVCAPSALLCSYSLHAVAARTAWGHSIPTGCRAQTTHPNLLPLPNRQAAEARRRDGDYGNEPGVPGLPAHLQQPLCVRGVQIDGAAPSGCVAAGRAPARRAGPGAPPGRRGATAAGGARRFHAI